LNVDCFKKFCHKPQIVKNSASKEKLVYKGVDNVHFIMGKNGKIGI